MDGDCAQPVIEYSTGMRKKIGLAAALLHGPRLLVLDEPFEGVDPISAATVRTILGRFVAGGGSVIFSSHVMALVEQLCSHVAIIATGRVLASGPIGEVRGGRALEAVFVELVGARVVIEAPLPILEAARALRDLPEDDRIKSFDTYRARILELPDAISVASPARREELCRIVVQQVVIRDRQVETIDWTPPARPFFQRQRECPQGDSNP